MHENATAALLRQPRPTGSGHPERELPRNWGSRGRTQRISAPQIADAIVTDVPKPIVARLVVIAITAFCIRVGVAALFVGLAAEPRGSAQPDQVDYEQLAWSIVADGRYAMPDGTPTAHRPPGTSLALVPVYWAFGRSFTAARVWFCLFGAVTCFFTGLLAREVFRSDTAALAAATILAVYPGHFYYSMHFVSEVPYGLWLTLGLLLVLRPTSTPAARRLLDAGAGVVAGLATLTRPQLLPLLPLAVLAVAVARPRRATIGRAAVVAVAFVVSLAPWVVRNVVVMHRPTVSTVGGYTFWGAHNPVILRPDMVGLWVRTSDLTDATHPLTGTEVENEAAAWRYGLEFVEQHVRDMPRIIVWKVLRLLAPFEDTPNRAVYWAFAFGWMAVAPLLLVGVRAAMLVRPTAALTLLLPLAATVASTLVFYGAIRFRDSTAPLLACLAGGGVASLLGRLAAPRESRHAGIRQGRDDAAQTILRT